MTDNPSLQSILELLRETNNEVKKGNEDTQALKIMMEQFKNELGAMNSKIEALEANQKQFESSTSGIFKNIEERFSVIENKTGRERNVIIFNFPETENEDEECLAQNTVTFLAENLNVNIGLPEIDFIKRLGHQSTKNRPVLLKFLTMRRKFQVLKAARANPHPNIRISWDYSPQERVIRKQLWPYIKAAREKNLQAKFQGVKAHKWDFLLPN